MTREEAITAVKEVTGMSLPWNDRHYEALQMAITALQTDGDCISRQAAIDTIEHYLKHPPKNHSELFVQGMDDAYYRTLSILRTLPSVQPDNSCDGCRYENADDGVLVPCGFCKRSHPDNYERRTDEQTD